MQVHPKLLKTSVCISSKPREVSGLVQCWHTKQNLLPLKAEELSFISFFSG